MVAWDVEEFKDAKLAAELVSRACLKERIIHRRKQPLILHADNGNALAAGFRAAIACCDAGGATGGTRSLEFLLQAEVSNYNPYSESLSPPVNTGLITPAGHLAAKGDACLWVSSFVDWYNYQQRHSGI